MPQTLTKVDAPPEWIQQFSDEIDKLDFGPGFARMNDDTSWSFGVETGVGPESLKAFFHRIDDPLISTHTLLDCWSGDERHIVRGTARVEPKDGHAPAVDVPFVWIFSMMTEDSGNLASIYIVNGPVKTDSVL